MTDHRCHFPSVMVEHIDARGPIGDPSTSMLWEVVLPIREGGEHTRGRRLNTSILLNKNEGSVDHTHFSVNKIFF